jgi:signal transduction histidine kinase
MRIVRQLLNLAAPFNLCRQPVDLAQVVTSVIEIVETDTLRIGVRIDLEPRAHVLVDADPDLTHQVVLNIIVNGIQAMPAGGTLRVGFLPEPVKRGDSFFNGLVISDTGTGVPTDHLAAIFEPFYTTKEVGRGVGLGLTVSHRIVEEHGGWIDVCNNEEGGASFTIYLSACDYSAGTFTNEVSETSAL